MQSVKSASPVDWGGIATEFLGHIPTGSLSEALLRSLQTPSYRALLQVAEALQRGGEWELSLSLFERLAASTETDPVPLVRFAQLATKHGRAADGAAAWRLCMQRFATIAKPVWFVQFANVLRAANLPDEEFEAVGELLRRFPEDHETLRFRAQDAGRKSQWTDAAELWVRILDKAVASENPAWLSEAGWAFFRAWRTQEALDLWQDTSRRFPDFVPARRMLATANEELGRWAAAANLWDELWRNFSASKDQIWLYGLAKCQMESAPLHLAEKGIAELEKLCPDSPDAGYLALELADRNKRGAANLMSLAERYLLRFPDDRRLLYRYAELLLAEGQLDECERVVAKIEAGAEDAMALICRWRLLVDREDVFSIQHAASRAVAGRVWPAGDGVAVCAFLRRLRVPWATALADSLSENLASRFPTQWNVACQRIGVLITLGRDAEALEMIDTIPSHYERSQVLELRAWAADRKGDSTNAESLRTKILAIERSVALHGPKPALELIGAGPDNGPNGTLTLFTVVRDEMHNLPDFFRHHRKLGVRQFIVVDNMSTDGTEAFLLREPGVVLYRTADSYPASSAGMRWINELINMHALGRWSLYADADEWLIYPAYETISIDKLVEYLELQGALAVSGFMLDVYPARLIDTEGRRARHEDCIYYDTNYNWHGWVKPPYRIPRGGVRYRLFSACDPLHKIPIIRGGEVAYLGAHETTTSRFADVSCLFLHHKCIDILTKSSQYLDGKGPKPLDRSADSKRRYERYAVRLKSLATEDLREQGTSEILADSLTLADRGLMQASENYRRWVAAQLPRLATATSFEPETARAP